MLEPVIRFSVLVTICCTCITNDYENFNDDNAVLFLADDEMVIYNMSEKLLFTTLCLANFFCQIDGLNISRLMSLYIDACGEKELCLDWPDLTNYTSHPILRRCPPCSCDDSCVRNLNCCPDKFFLRPLAVLDTPHLYISDSLLQSTKIAMLKYEIITTCQKVLHLREADAINNCENYQDNFLHRTPVTSMVSNFSYRNKFCAFCNGETESNLETWDIALKETVVNFINFIESDSQLRFYSNVFDTTVIFTPPLSVQGIVKAIDTTDFEDLQGPCQDEVLELACSSSYVNQFRSYQNIFCYMCQMKNWKKTGPLINSCSSPIDKITQKCLEHPESSITYPYKNFYCYTCNIPHFTEIYLDGDRCADGECSHNNTLYYRLIEFSTMTQERKTFYIKPKFYLSFMNITLNDNYLLRFIRETDIRNATFQNHNQLDEKEKEDKLKQYAFVNPHRICRPDLLPQGVSNGSRQCSCSYSCLFEGKCTCCVDTAVLHPTECMTNYNYQESKIKSKSYPEVGIKIVSTCYKRSDVMNFSVEYMKIAHLCERNLFVRDFDLLIWSNKVTYKNIFCFLCNTNYSIKNNVLEYESFEVLEFTIICNSPLNYVYAMSFNLLVQQMNRQGCRMSYNTHKSTMCNTEDSSHMYISQCPQIAHDHPVRWLCENTSINNFISVDKYKNEFCQFCSAYETKETSNDLNGCMDRNFTPITDKNKCLNNELYPLDIFCTHCAIDEKPIYDGNFTVSDCKPFLGSKLYVASNLVRDLFSPSWILREFGGEKTSTNAALVCDSDKQCKVDENKCKISVLIQYNDST